MKKEQQIEEMAKTIFLYVDSKGMKNVYIVGSEFADDLKTHSHNYGVAETLYNAGYRKVVFGRDDFVNLLNEEIKELSIIEKTRKETAREILRTLYNYPHEYHEDKIKELAKYYEVEIEEWKNMKG